jgi:hypothetical protein
MTSRWTLLKVAVRELLAPLIISQAGVTPVTPPAGSSGGSPDLSGVLWLLMKGKKKKKPKLDFLRLLKIHKALGNLDLFLSLTGN